MVVVLVLAHQIINVSQANCNCFIVVCLDIWIKAYSLIKRKSAFYVDIDNSRHYWDYDEGVVRMAVVSYGGMLNAS